jgi:hypothetical protein
LVLRLPLTSVVPGLPSKKRQNWEEHANQRLLAAKEAGDRERELRQLDTSILVLDGDLQAALAVRDAQPVLVSQADIDQGKLDFRSQFMYGTGNNGSKKSKNNGQPHDNRNGTDGLKHSGFRPRLSPNDYKSSVRQKQPDYALNNSKSNDLH